MAGRRDCDDGGPPGPPCPPAPPGGALAACPGPPGGAPGSWPPIPGGAGGWLGKGAMAGCLPRPLKLTHGLLLPLQQQAVAIELLYLEMLGDDCRGIYNERNWICQRITEYSLSNIPTHPQTAAKWPAKVRNVAWIRTKRAGFSSTSAVPHRQFWGCMPNSAAPQSDQRRTAAGTAWVSHANGTLAVLHATPPHPKPAHPIARQPHP